MLEHPAIQTRGFRNVTDDGAVSGFQFELRNPNYRGVPASMLDGIEVVVDGTRIEPNLPRWTVQGRTFGLEELAATEDVRWHLDEPAVITVPLPGGLSAGVHHLEVTVFLRRSYFPPAVARSRFQLERDAVIVPPAPSEGFRYAVSTFSFTGDIYTMMTLEDVVADIADLGAQGIEILGESNVPGYPEPPTGWIDEWHRLVDRYGITPTNFGSWVDTTRWADRDLTVEEAAQQLGSDLRLASRLGFTSLRPKFGVTTFDLDPHPVWRPATERVLDLAAELDVVICPEIHAPTPIQHPVTEGYLDLIERSGSEHFRLLVDTGIFQTAPVLESSEDLGSEDEVPPPLRALAVPMADLVSVLPYVYFIQAKFFEIDDDLRDKHVPWDDIVPTLLDNGWSGWISSEYEGRRDPGRGRDQVRRQHALLRSLHAAHGSPSA